MANKGKPKYSLLSPIRDIIVLIPMILQDASLRMPEQFMGKAPLFIKDCSFKNRGNELIIKRQ
ncbi:hypothetical protein A9Q74_01555 [Colwellia sp. 39_35_sub15_T18]|nr:hypothetical protein A9Q74_01555 [Colwellia sp. 39_35_sub15_T18]